MLFGCDSVLANGTNRIHILLQNFTAVFSFKSEQIKDFDLSFKMSLFTLPGAILGAIFAVKIDAELFNKILAFVIIILLILMVIPRKKNGKQDSDTEVNKLIYPVMFFIGFYGGFIQAGAGIFIMAAITGLLKLDLIRTNAHKVFIAFIFTIPALIIFIISDQIRWDYGLSLGAGSVLGGWFSAKFSVKKGEGVIRVALVIAAIIMLFSVLNPFKG